MYVSSLILGYLKLCSRASAVRASDQGVAAGVTDTRAGLGPMLRLSLVWTAVVAAAAAVPTIPKTMRHVVAQDVVGTDHGCKAPYNPTCFDVLKILTPKPGWLEVLVKMSSASVNPSDLDLEQQIGRLEGTLGVDFAGEVVALGPGPHSLKIGDQVWGVTKGSYADYTLAGDAQTGLVPAGLNMSIAGAIPEVGATSLQCLYAMGAKNGGWKGRNLTVVVTSGTGGTGFIGVQLAKALGAGRIITSTSGAANIAFAKRLGADQVFDYKVQDIFDPGALANNSVDMVYDNYGAKGTADKAMPAMKPGGVFLLLPGGENGALSKHPKMGVKQINFGVMDALIEKGDINTLATLFEAGHWKPYVDPRSPFTLEQISLAFSLSATGSVVGKIAIVP